VATTCPQLLHCALCVLQLQLLQCKWHISLCFCSHVLCIFISKSSIVVVCASDESHRFTLVMLVSTCITVHSMYLQYIARSSYLRACHTVLTVVYTYICFTHCKLYKQAALAEAAEASKAAQKDTKLAELRSKVHSTAYSEPPAGTATAARVRLQLPNGTKLDRYVYLYYYCCYYCTTHSMLTV
jgi:hypothetical protein